MNDLQVALVGVWGVILAYTQTRSFRSLRRTSPRPPFRTIRDAVLGIVVGLGFVVVAAAHFTGIHRQRNVHIFGILAIAVIVLAVAGMWQRRADLRRLRPRRPAAGSAAPVVAAQGDSRGDAPDQGAGAGGGG
jgi:uncharacterized protein involved in response to NO